MLVNLKAIPKPAQAESELPKGELQQLKDQLEEIRNQLRQLANTGISVTAAPRQEPVQRTERMQEQPAMQRTENIHIPRSVAKEDPRKEDPRSSIVAGYLFFAKDVNGSLFPEYTTAKPASPFCVKVMKDCVAYFEQTAEGCINAGQLLEQGITMAFNIYVDGQMLTDEQLRRTGHLKFKCTDVPAKVGGDFNHAVLNSKGSLSFDEIAFN